MTSRLAFSIIYTMLKTNDNFKAAKAINQVLAARVVKLANKKGLTVVHNASNSRWDARHGFHRYLVLPKDAKNQTVRSKELLFKQEAPHSRSGKPSIYKEANCLIKLINFLNETKT